jgi:hypothetical protein
MILFKVLTKKFVEMALHNFRTFMWISTNFTHYLYEITTVRLGCYRFCASLVLKMLMGAHKTQRMASALTFLEQYHKDGNEFLNHIVWVTGDETLASFVMLKPMLSQSSGCTHIHQTSRKILNKCLPTRKPMAAVFWDRKVVLMVEFMQQETTITSEV